MKLLPLILRVKARIAAYLSRPKLRSGLAVLILLFSSTQLGFHFWPDSAFVYGLRIDYLSPTLYLLDLLIIIYLILLPGLKSKIWNLESLLPLLLINLIYSLNPLATLSWSLHLLFYLLFILTLSPTLIRHLLSAILSLAIFFQVILASAHFFLGHTLQGPFYWLGERALSVGSPNVAKGEWFGEIVLRSYGTFSHPNALAGWLVLSTLIVIYLSRSRFLIFFTAALTIIGLILTQSRAAAFSFFVFVIPIYLLRPLRVRLLYFIFLLISGIYLLTSNPLSLSDLSVSERLHLQTVSSKIITSYPLFGTGASASISSYPALSPNLRLLQPDHNSFTLLLSWFGFIGLLSIFPFLKSKIWNLKSLLPLLPLLLLDHYLLTSPQGLFILLLYLKVSRA